jgi:chemotaxis protein methyltransferase CheR
VNRGFHATWVPPLAGLVQERLGLHFPRERWPDLVRGVRAAARETGFGDTDAFARIVLQADRGPCFDTLACALTIGETYFFREPRSFEVLRDVILPELIRQRRTGVRHLRLWSAACCTGEEAYTLAILLDGLLPERGNWRIKVLGTDLNPRYLSVAARGEYGEWSFRGTPAALKQRYFSQVSHRLFAVAAPIRSMVTFRPLNLVDMRDPGWENDSRSMDLILCRNVLMYFSPAQARRAVERLQRSLSDGGWLGVSATEGPARFEPLVTVRFDGAVFYRKVASASLATQPSKLSSPPLTSGVPAETPGDGGAREPADALAAPAADSLQLARRHADAGRLDLALAAVERALATDKLDAGAHHLHAAILDELGRVEDAQAALKRALYLEPDFVLAHHALGRLAGRHGNAVQAQRHFSHALSLLGRYRPDEPLPRADGLAAGQLRLIIEASRAKVRT